ncbi:MAG: hypothetical protein IT324_02750 [Anaerolineae bacterium]|nr:hypothetical protein [Anaerolineae bacterium]
MAVDSDSPARPSDESPAPSSKPFMRFYFPAALRDKTLKILTTIEQAKDSTQHRNTLSDLVMELTNSGIDYYFMKPLRLAKMGFVVEQSATVSMVGATRVLGSVIYGIIGRMDKTQLLIVCSHIRQLME